MRISQTLTPEQLKRPIEHALAQACPRVQAVIDVWRKKDGAPVFTVEGQYTARGWTEWTQGFVYGDAILTGAMTGDKQLLELGREGTCRVMHNHVTHFGVHDHGFNNVSTYGNLRRLMLEGDIPFNPWELDFYEMALMASGAVQAARWSEIAGGGGYIYSFNGPQSLFVDTVRTCRAPALAHLLGHTLMGEQDRKISLLERAVQHLLATAKHSVFYGEGRDAYDKYGRTAHEIIFNPTNGVVRCPSTQQGYSAFTTWTRGLAWAVLGFPEQLEFLHALPQHQLENVCGGSSAIFGPLIRAARATADFYIENSAADGIPFWDTGAPGLAQMGDYLGSPANPFNEHEPVDSSAAAIAAQGLLRLGHFLMNTPLAHDLEAGKRYWDAGLTVAKTLLAEPYLCLQHGHQGLLLHVVYHRPNGWDHVPAGSKIPYGEAAMWGDYHLLELMYYLQQIIAGKYYTFFGPMKDGAPVRPQ